MNKFNSQTFSKEEIYRFWTQAPPTIEGMTQTNHISTFDEVEREEILGHLPDYSGKKVLELASGIGRFTGRLAEKASHVDTIDFAPQFIEKNQETHQYLTNITYRIDNVMDLDCNKETYDLIFINWLFMYLSDEDTSLLIERLAKWLSKSGILFLRESCYHIGRYTSGKYTAIYRPIDEYSSLLKKHFHINKHDIVFCYFIHRKLINQHFWLCQKS